VKLPLFCRYGFLDAAALGLSFLYNIFFRQLCREYSIEKDVVMGPSKTWALGRRTWLPGVRAGPGHAEVDLVLLVKLTCLTHLS